MLNSSLSNGNCIGVDKMTQILSSDDDPPRLYPYGTDGAARQQK
jgi:hypothetical protein